jgi:hypothetical protein
MTLLTGRSSGAAPPAPHMWNQVQTRIPQPPNRTSNKLSSQQIKQAADIITESLGYDGSMVSLRDDDYHFKVGDRTIRPPVWRIPTPARSNFTQHVTPDFMA